MVVFVVFFAFSVVDHEEVNRWCIFTELCVAGNSEGNSDSLGSCDATLAPPVQDIEPNACSVVFRHQIGVPPLLSTTLYGISAFLIITLLRALLLCILGM